MRQSTAESWRRDVRPGVFVVLFGIVVAVLSVLIVGLLVSPWIDGLDASLSAAIRALRTPALVEMAKAVTHLADTWSVIVMTTVAAGVLFASGRRPEAAFVVATVAGGWALGSLIQLLVHRARPVNVNLIPLPDQYSFPSGHSLAAVLFFGALSFIVLGEVRRPWLRYTLVAFFAFLAIAIGMSRVYLGVHWVGDVVGAWLLGGAVLLVAVLGFFALTQPRDAER